MGTKRRKIPEVSSADSSKKRPKNTSHSKASSSSFLWILILSSIPLLLIYGFYTWYTYHLSTLVIEPFKGEKVIQTSRNTQNIEWGTYRPNTYFGIKSKTPKSPVFGLMWMPQFGASERPPPIRHWCDQGDGISKYGWTMHDGENFGRQEIYDKWLVLVTDFIRIDSGWKARVKVKPKPGMEKAVFSLFFYVAIENDGELLLDVNKKNLKSVSGRTNSIGSFSLEFLKTANVLHQDYLETLTPGFHQLKEGLLNGMVFKKFRGGDENYIALNGLVIPKEFQKYPRNFVVKQYTFQGDFEMEVHLQSSPDPNDGAETFNEIFNKYAMAFNDKFENTFHLKSKGFNEDKIKFAQATFSNLVGGIGYFYGSSKVKSRYVKEDPLDYWEAPLFTSVPSRSFFPRGFLWDEGFHNLVISRWNPELTKSILGHWMDLMNNEGWIPREQILGLEARAKVPDEFVVQHDENANPPTFFLPLEYLMNEGHLDQQYLNRIFPRLVTWYNWFNKTQTGNIPGSYRWKGRDEKTKRELNPKTLTSGLDDYPRSSNPSTDERHLDLRCWMLLASKVMTVIAEKIGKDAKPYKQTYDYLMDENLLSNLHWSKKMKRYSDYGLHTDRVALVRPKPKQPNPHVHLDKERVIRGEPKNKYVDTTFGYVSLFPLAMKMLKPDSDKLEQILRDLRDENLLWTNFGLRSLAKSSPLYKKHNTEHDPPYWRGAIWINMNYMVVNALYHYSKIDGPHQSTAQKLYSELRQNLINNIYRQYERSGFVWENYDDTSGSGKGCHPFTGWSSLVINLMAEKYN